MLLMTLVENPLMILLPLNCWISPVIIPSGPRLLIKLKLIHCSGARRSGVFRGLNGCQKRVYELKAYSVFSATDCDHLGAVVAALESNCLELAVN